jgi:uncharacterized membrane protein YedE/YeeE
LTDYDLPGFPPLPAALAELFYHRQVTENRSDSDQSLSLQASRAGAGRESGCRMSEFLVNISGSGPAASTMGIWASMALLGVLGFILGFALNHGSICTVIATRELVSEKRPARFIAIVECAVWATLVYAILEASPMMQEGWSPIGYLVPAAILFGLGTYVNGACVFGSVGRFGNGEIDFGFTFLGIAAVFF